MKKFLICAMTLILIFLPQVEAADGTGELVIFHTNDTHARILPTDDKGATIGFSKIVALVKAAKLENPDTLWLDAGDTLHGLPQINISRGENMVLLLNEAGVDALAPGNHDFDYGAERLLELSKELKPAVLSANTVWRGTNKMFLKQYKIFRLPNKITVGVFGLTTPETLVKSKFTDIRAVDFLNPFDQARKMVEKLRGKCDVLIALTHLGLDETSDFTSELLAKEVSGIDLIVDGHSHTLLENGLTVGNTLIVQTGEYGHNLGKVSVDLLNHKIISKSARILTKSEFEEADAETEKILAEIETRSEKIFGEVIACSNKNLSGNRILVRRDETELGNLAADSIKWRTGADIGVINGGNLRAGLPKDKVTRRNVLEIFPFGNVVQLAEIKGSAIREMLELSVSKYPYPSAGFLSVSGLTFTCDAAQPVGQRVSDILVNGQSLDENKIYTLGTDDFLLSGGDDFTMLKNLKMLGEFETCDEVFIMYLREVGTRGFKIGRIKMLNEVPVPEEILKAAA